MLRLATVSCAFDVGRCDDLGWQATNAQGGRKVGRTRHTVRGMRGCAACDKGRGRVAGSGHREQRHVVDIARFRDQGESIDYSTLQHDPLTGPTKMEEYQLWCCAEGDRTYFCWTCNLSVIIESNPQSDHP